MSIETQNTETSPKNPLADFSFHFSQKVAWGELDALKHLNNVVYHRYAESARIAYLSEMGMFNEEQTLVMAHSSCTYLKPVFFPDTLEIGLRCKKLGNTSVIIEYCFYSTQQQTVVATAEAVVVSLAPDAKSKLPWTDAQREKVAKMNANLY